MPKLFGKNVPPVVLGAGVLLAGYLVYGVVFPSDEPSSLGRKTGTSVKKTVAETDYQPADYTFTVDPLSDTAALKDAFRPLIVKNNGSTAGGVPNIDNYTYSGMAAINGDASGLLENGQSGQGDFVKVGQRWHDTWLVIKIDPEEIQLKNDGGDVMTLMAGASAQKTASNAPAPAYNGPMNPMMVGPIGGQDLSVGPAQIDNGNGGNNGPGRRRRGGRGRGGGGG